MTKDDKIKQHLEHERKMLEIKHSLPPAVYDVFTKEWANFIDSCTKNTGEHIEDMEKYFDEYLAIFMKYPH
ncbi:uncharacterized protein METZ01_LOCUS235016 [marine metagenome]|jgi:hypothetical protein|uniref:Uncharacterized protein n=1 Tax=marine metagenome TaxID=408172 RepID=A0A382H4P5_9ZZZZ